MLISPNIFFLVPKIMEESSPILKLLWLLSWVVPLPSKSHHQDYYIFRRGSRTKPSFATGILGPGATQELLSKKKTYFCHGYVDSLEWVIAKKKAREAEYVWTTVAYVISQVGRSNCGPFGKGRDLKKMLNDLPINYEKFLGHHQHGSHIFFCFWWFLSILQKRPRMTYRVFLAQTFLVPSDHVACCKQFGISCKT